MNHSIRASKGFKFCGLVLPKSRFQFLGAKMVGNSETPGINPDTPENPDIPDIKSGYSEFFRIVDVGLSRVVVCVYGLVLFQNYKS